VTRLQTSRGPPSGPGSFGSPHRDSTPSSNTLQAQPATIWPTLAILLVRGDDRLSRSPAVRAPSTGAVLTPTSPTNQPDEHRSESNADKHIDDGKGRIKEAAGSLTEARGERLPDTARGPALPESLIDSLDAPGAE
jgi:hypothetical protein